MMKKMKRWLAAVMAALMLLSVCETALAEEPMEFAVEECGITFTWPEDFDAIPGMVMLYPEGQIAESPDPNIWHLGFIYAAMNEETYAKLDNSEESEEEKSKIVWLGNVYVADVGQEDLIKGLCELYETKLDDPEVQNIEEFSSIDNYHFYFQPENDANYMKAIGADYSDAFKKKQDAVLEAMKAAKLYAPVAPDGDFRGQSFKFETTDLDGNPVTSDEIYADNEITMFNYWGTWCAPCVGELAELAGIHTQLREMGCGVVGILEDANKEGGIEAAKALMAENGTNYPVLIPSPEMAKMLDWVTGYPTTFFADKTGTIVGTPISRATPKRYVPAVEELLNGEVASAEEAAPEEAQTEQKATEGAYRVIVEDADGNPVKGVVVQFCNDDSCSYKKTDAEGVASFDMPEGDGYTVHILKIPDGFATDDTEYKVPDHYEDMHVTLKSAR